MKYVGKIFGLSLILSMCLICSCSDETINSLSSETKIVRLNVKTTISNYEGTRAASDDWQEGDVLYLSTSQATGQATYNDGEWTLAYTGNISSDTNCNLYYFENIEGKTNSQVTLTSSSAIYYDSSAKLVKSGDAMLLEGYLTPKAARIRFQSSNSNPIQIDGFSCYTSLNLSTMKLQTATAQFANLSFSSGYTPYLYIACDENPNQTLTLTTKEAVFSRKLSSKQLSAGKSGYFVVPTEQSLEGWTFVSEAPAAKWDGNIATEFAGGNGTAGNPYKIETGGQLLLMKNNSTKGKYFVLNANIDLDNKNWLPFVFEGTLDGQGYTISNLYIDRSDDGQGLFSNKTNSGEAVVQNVNIKGVKIEAENNGNVGALFGYLDTGTIKNVNVTFLESSSILGTDYVGGLVGKAYCYVNIENCHVYSVSSNSTISGSNYVGGLCGYFGCYNSDCVTSCSVNVNILGNGYVGGLIGDMYGGSLSKCEYIGDITGTSYVGGIEGCGGGKIIASRAITNIKASSSFAGGISGIYGTAIACYSDGTITGTTSNIGGIIGYNGDKKLCYTTMECGLGSSCKDCATTSSKGSGTNTKVNCTNITEFLKEAYSEYAEYYDFNNTWTWTGTVNGKTVSVSCPKLAWENEVVSQSSSRASSNVTRGSYSDDVKY